jgi:HEAT repeat protein
MDQQTFDGLISDLRGRFKIVRQNAVKQLVPLGARAVPALIETLTHRNPEVQAAAADALKQIGTPEALAAADAWHNKAK